MPEKEGLETIRELMQIDPQAKIIAMSTSGEKPFGHLGIALRMGAIRMIHKPSISDELLTAVAQVISEGRWSWHRATIYGVSSADCSGDCDGVAGAVFGSFHAWSQARHKKKSKSGSYSLRIKSLRVRDERHAGQGAAVSDTVAMPIYEHT
jgi:DNA-binding response OmpR family regulator